MKHIRILYKCQVCDKTTWIPEATVNADKWNNMHNILRNAQLGYPIHNSGEYRLGATISHYCDKERAQVGICKLIGARLI